MESSKSFKLILGLLLTILVLSATYYVIFQDSWFDEATNSYKPWLVSEGLAQPFQNFFEKHPPVIFYVQVYWQGLFGPSILAYRIFSLIFLIGIVLLLFDSLRRVGGRWLGIFGSALLVFSPYAISKFVTASPYAFIGFFSLLSLWFLQLEHWSISRRVTFASVAMSLAFLGRYNMLPALILLWCFVLLRWRPRLALLSIIVSVVSIFLFSLPYLILDAEYAISFFFEMFGPFAAWLPLDFLSISPRSSEVSSWFAYLLNESRLKMMIQVFTTFFHVWSLFLFGILFAVVRKRNQLNSFLRAHPLFVWSVLLTAVLFLAHFFFGPNRHKMYLLYFLPFLLFAAGYAAHFLISCLKEQGLWKSTRRPLVILACSVLLLSSVSVALSGNDTIFWNRWDYQDTDLARIKRGGKYLAALSTPRDVILTLDNADHVLSAKRFMIPERLNRHDVYLNLSDEQRLARFNFYNTSMFLNWLRKDADLFIAQKDARLARLEPIAGERGTAAMMAEVEAILTERYKLVGNIAGVYPRKETRGQGVMEIYRRLPIKK